MLVDDVFLMLRPCRRYDVRLRRRGGRSFLIRRDAAVELNNIQVAIWLAIDGQRDCAEIVATISARPDSDPVAAMLAVHPFLASICALNLVSMFKDDKAAASSLAMRWIQSESSVPAGGAADGWATEGLDMAVDRFFQVIGEAMYRSSDASIGARTSARLGSVNRKAPEVADEILRRDTKLISWRINLPREVLTIYFVNSIYEGNYRHRH